MIHVFSNIAGYKINVQKLAAFSKHQFEAVEREIKELIPCQIAPKPVKYMGINLNKEIKYLYSGKYKNLMNEIEDDTNKWKNIPCSCIGRTNIVKMYILPKAIYTFSVTDYESGVLSCPAKEQMQN